MTHMGTNLRNLAYVIATADHGSLAAAAEQVRISPSAISTAIKAQEKELGYALFVRRPAQRLKLTPMGREFIANAKLLMERFDAFIDTSRGLRETLAGQLAIGCFSSFAPLVVPPVLRHLRDAYPQLSISLVEGDHAQLMAALEGGDVELAVTYDFMRDRSLHYEPIFAVRPYALVSADHRLARRRKISLESLVSEDLIAVDMPSIRNYMLSLFAAKGLTPRIWQLSKSIGMLHGMVANGLGYSIAFFRTPGQLGVPDDLRCVPLAETVPIHHVAIATPRHATLSRRAQAFIRACHDVFESGGLKRRYQVGV
jgi:DNA-binding transcriptional LysR family regulator